MVADSERPDNADLLGMLSAANQVKYYQQLRECTARFDTLCQRDLLDKVRAHLSENSFSVIKKSASESGPAGLVLLDDLRFLCGYFSFLEALHIPTHNVSLELRVEERSGALEKGFLVLGLVPLETSLLSSLRIRTLLWTHSEDLIYERFLGREHGPYLCGSYPGRSKFFAAFSEAVELTKDEVVSVLGIEGYLKVEKPGPLYIVRATMSWEDIVKQVQPKVAVLYKKRGEVGTWRKQDGFLQNSIPGFTFGGVAEIVGKTFQMAAANLDDLRKKGVEIIPLQ